MPNSSVLHEENPAPGSGIGDPRDVINIFIVGLSVVLSQRHQSNPARAQ